MTRTFREAAAHDWSRIDALLRAAELPLDGAHDHLDDFVVCCEGDELLGTAALEVHGRTGLLRSVVVAEPRRKVGLGRELVGRLLERARERGLGEVVLLTTTAAAYFTRFGFREIPRAAVPSEALASAELRGACPDTAAVMALPL